MEYSNHAWILYSMAQNHSKTYSHYEKYIEKYISAKLGPFCHLVIKVMSQLDILPNHLINKHPVITGKNNII